MADAARFGRRVRRATDPVRTGTARTSATRGSEGLRRDYLPSASAVKTHG